MNPKTIAILVVLAFSGAIFFLLVMPKFSEVTDLGVNIAKQEDILKIATEKFEATKKAIEQFKKISQRDIELIESAFPSDPDLPDLFVLTNSLISSAGLLVEDIDINIGDEGDMGVSVNASGSYESLKAFALSAQSSLRIFDIESINISKDDQSGEGFGSFEFQIIMNTYFEQ